MLTNLTEVLGRFAVEIDLARSAGSRIAFFMSLYRRVTAEIKRRIEQGEFDDSVRMTHLDLDFVNRYFDALDAFRSGGLHRRCWQVAFEAAAEPNLLIIQHLLLGMNAHINFDLAQSAAKVAGNADGLSAMKNDFAAVNEVFATLIDEVQQRIGQVSPRFHELDDVVGEADEAILGFSIARARQLAWRTAETLVRLGPAASLLIPVQDSLVAGFGEALIAPIVVNAVKPIRDAESDDVPHVIDVLES